MRFIQKLAYRSAFFIQNSNKSSHENKRILYFGFQAIYGDIVKFAVVICASTLLDSLIPVLFVTLAFALLRRYAGGFHMDTELKCLLSTVCSFVIPGTIISMFSFSINNLLVLGINLVVFIICLILLLKYAPKDCVNRPIDEDESVIFKKRAIRDFIILTVISVTLAIFNKPLFSISILSGIIIEVFSLIPVGYNLFKSINSFSLQKKIPTSK